VSCFCADSSFSLNYRSQPWWGFTAELQSRVEGKEGDTFSSSWTSAGLGPSFGSGTQASCLYFRPQHLPYLEQNETQHNNSGRKHLAGDADWQHGKLYLITENAACSKKYSCREARRRNPWIFQVQLRAFPTIRQAATLVVGAHAEAALWHEVFMVAHTMPLHMAVGHLLQRTCAAADLSVQNRDCG